MTILAITWVLTVLVETNVLGLLSEALTAHVQTVLSDQTRVSAANSALSRTLTVVSWVGEPNVFVSHVLSVSNVQVAREVVTPEDYFVWFS